MITGRRLFLAVALSILSPRVFAQSSTKIWRVGFLAPRRPASLDCDPYGAFALGMRELGYVEGNNLLIEWRFADGRMERLPQLPRT